jgi:DNA-binding transcriptional LysR family regulator
MASRRLKNAEIDGSEVLQGETVVFDLYQLRCFIAVAEELHFGHAAKRLHLTQPPISRQIQLLESQLKVRLFERTSKIVRLTAAGKSFYFDAIKIISLVELTEQSVQKIAKGTKGTLVVGFTSGAGYLLLPMVLKCIKQLLPDVELILKEIISRDLPDAIESQAIDIGIVRPSIRRTNIVLLPCYSEQLVLALPEPQTGTWPIDRVNLTDCEGRELIMFSPFEAEYLHNLLYELYTSAGVRPHIVSFVSHIHTMLACVQAGMGAAIMPISATNLRFEGVSFRSVVTAEPKPVKQYFAYRADNSNPSLRAFCEWIRSCGDEWVLRGSNSDRAIPLG